VTPAMVARAEAAQSAYDRASALKSTLAGHYGDPLDVASGRIELFVPEADREQGELLGGVGEALRHQRLAARLVREARSASEHERFLHWELAFPNVWTNLASAQPGGGFDAV